MSNLLLRGFAGPMILGLLSVAPAWAHHSTAAYDYSRSVQLTGTVKEFQWRNPHMFIHLLVTDPQGHPVEWNIECGTPNINVRHGWKQSDLSPGAKVTTTIHPMRDGSLAGTLDNVTLADGRLLYGPGHDIVAAGPGKPGGSGPSTGSAPVATDAPKP